MNEFFRQVGNDGKNVWAQMSQAQRVLLGVVGAGAVGLLIFLVVWAQSPNYATLYTKLSDQDAGAIVAKLKEQNVPYQLDGASLKVPSAQVHEVRLAMAGEGLPAGGTVGFEMFNNPSFSQTDFDKNVNYQRALEGELARTIGTIQGVEHVRVHVVMPKDSLFIEEQEDTTASVMLTVAPNAKLEIGQIRTIQHLVSKSVPKLVADKVFVTDTAGRDYSEELAKGDPRNLAGTDLSARQLEIKRKYETELTRKVQGQLDQVLGPGNSVVRVNTLWDFSQIETNAKVYTSQVPGEQAMLLSRKYKKEEYNGALGGKDGGVPGTVPNAGAPGTGYQGVTSGQNGNYKNDEGTDNFQPNEEIQRRIKEPAVLKDTTISVAFNAPSDPGAPAGLIRQRADNIARMVAASAGISDVQNKVFVNAMPFNTEASDAAAEAATAAARNAAFAKWGTVGAAVALALLAFALLFASFRRRREEEIAAIEEAMPRLPSDDLGITLIDDDDALLAVDQAQSRALVSAEEQRLVDMTKELASYIKSQPQDAVKLVRAWMTEDE